MGTAPTFLRRVFNPFSISDKALCFHLPTDLVSVRLSNSPASPLPGFSGNRSANSNLVPYRKFLTRHLVHICNHNSFSIHLSYTDLRLLSTLVTFTIATTIYLPSRRILTQNANRYRLPHHAVHVCGVWVVPHADIYINPNVPCFLSFPNCR